MSQGSSGVPARSWRGPEPVVQMTRALAALFQRMGMAGWVVLFDEAEAIAQVRAPSRRKAYDFLARWLAPDAPTPGLFPVFAFTEDLLWRMEADDAPLRREQLTLHALGDLTDGEWAHLADRLVPLHARAFRWRPDPAAAGRALRARLGRAGGAETRLKLKALVDELDLQEQAIDSR